MRLPERPGRRSAREPDNTGNRAYSGHIPDIFRTFPGLVGHERFVVCRIVRRRITCGHARRVPYGLSPDRVRRACCVPYRPSPDHVPYRPSPTHVSSQLGPPSATSVSLPSSPLGTPNARRLPCPGPTYACSRRRQPWFTNVYSFTLPWRFIMARSAARLRRGVGPLSTPKAGAGRSRQRDIIGNNRTSSEHRPNISGHFRTFPDKKGSSRAVSSVAGSCAIKCVACERSRCRIACRRVGRVRKEPVPDRVP